MEKLTKSLSLFKERNCSVSIVLDSRTRRKNACEFPLSIRFTIDRKFFYFTVGSSFTGKKFSDICNATKCKSENYKLQKEWKDTIAPKYKEILMNLNKGGILTFEMVRQCIMGEEVVLSKEDITQSQSFISIWEQVIHELRTEDGGARFTTAESYECSLKSFRKILGENAIKGFCICAAELQKWKDGMHNGVKDENGAIVGKISDTTAGIYLRCCRAVWNRCVHEGYLKDVPYPFSNKKEKGLVSIPKSAKRKQSFLNVNQMTELYNLFVSKKYPEHWSEEYVLRAHYSLGLFLAQYLCNGFNMADAGRLTYNSYYYQTNGKAFRFNRKKTSRRSADGSEVIVPIIPRAGPVPVHRGNLLQGLALPVRHPHGGPPDRKTRPSGYFRPADEERHNHQPEQIHPRTFGQREIFFHQPHGTPVLRAGCACAVSGYRKLLSGTVQPYSCQDTRRGRDLFHL